MVISTGFFLRRRSKVSGLLLFFPLYLTVGSRGLVYVPDYHAISHEYGWLPSQCSAAITRPVGVDARQRTEQNRGASVPGGIPQ